jgi:hypothetical protein
MLSKYAVKTSNEAASGENEWFWCGLKMLKLNNQMLHHQVMLCHPLHLCPQGRKLLVSSFSETQNIAY